MDGVNPASYCSHVLGRVHAQKDEDTESFLNQWYLFGMHVFHELPKNL